MLHQQSGHIVNISPLCRSADRRRSLCITGVDQGGCIAVTRALAIEYSGQGIRINTVALGAIKTPMHKIEAHDFLKSLQPIGRMGKIDEVVDAVMYLNDATFITGKCFMLTAARMPGNGNWIMGTEPFLLHKSFS
jgi:NAD(P)-dependent dehydrogenase (short-subunit alcohol dehydrogenase family)